MEEKKVFVTNSLGEKLVGVETVPSEAKRYPAVLMVHGFGVTKEEGGMFDDIAEHLCESGFLVYRFDFSGCGESEGEYSETTISKLKDDLSMVLNFVRGQDRVDDDRIGILAQSFGTSVTIALGPDVSAMVLMGSIANPKEVLADLFDENYNPDRVSTRKRSDGTTTRIKPGFWKDFEGYDLKERVNKVKCPILFINGSEDETVPVSETDELYSSFDGAKKKAVLEGAGHGLRPRRKEMHQILKDWFTEHLTQ